jgi:hypothetical protein
MLFQVWYFALIVTGRLCLAVMNNPTRIGLKFILCTSTLRDASLIIGAQIFMLQINWSRSDSVTHLRGAASGFRFDSAQLHKLAVACSINTTTAAKRSPKDKERLSDEAYLMVVSVATPFASNKPT